MPLDTRLRPGESYRTGPVFGRPAGARGPVPLFTESSPAARFVNGHGHGRPRGKNEFGP